MTEKHYGGASSHGMKNKNSQTSNKIIDNKKKTDDGPSEDNSTFNGELSKEDIKDIKLAGEIAKKVVDYAKSIIKKGMPLIEIANKVDAKIEELKAKPAFPINLSINEIAAHSTPSWNDETLASGLLKVDIGVQINGWTADTAFSMDLDNNEENKKLIKAAELAVKAGTDKINIGVKVNEIGKDIEKAIKSQGFNPIINLSGHSITQYDIHAGITIPNCDNSQVFALEPGVYAIEPFATNGLGTVRDGKPSGIYKLDREGAVRDTFAREVLQFIVDEYQTLPFCSRWIYKKFGSRGLLALRLIEQAGVLHHYSQLVESGKGKVAQAEHTVLLLQKEKVITTF